MTRKNGSETRQDEVERETREENRETISVVSLDRTPREEKRRREQAIAGDAPKVEFHERSWVPTRHDSMDEIRNAIDALSPVESAAAATVEPEPPVAEPEPPVTEPAAPSAGAIEDAPGPEAQARERVPERATRDPVEPLTAEERAVVDHNVHGHLLFAEVLYRTGQSFVAEARYRTSKGEERTTLVSVTGPHGRELDDVRRVVDDLAVKPPPAPMEPAPTKARFGFPKLKRGGDVAANDAGAEAKARRASKATDTTAAADEAIESARARGRFSWPKLGGSEEAPPHGDATPSEKKRFRFGRSK